MRLDCESIDSTYNSLENIFELPRTEIQTVFDEFDLDKFCLENPDAYPPGRAHQIVFDQLAGKAGLIRQPSEICWFHSTRTLPNTSFSDGIITLQQAIDQLWDLLFSLSLKTQTEWHCFRQEFETTHPSNSAGLYRMKIAQNSLGGPYASLIRDVALKSVEIGGQDYLRAPEIVEDICRCFCDRYGIDLLSKFREKTKPCIVKFLNREASSNALWVATYYLYLSRLGLPLNHLLLQGCYDGKGKPIPSGNIQRIDFLEDDD